MTLLSEFLNTDLIIAALRLTTPISLAAIGATICERSGIVNIAMEGIMLVGAFFSAIVSLVTGNPWLGLAAGIISGGLFVFLHAFATITLQIDHIVSGAVLNIIAIGFTRFFLVLYTGHPGSTDMINHTLADYTWSIPVLNKIPFFGKVLFSQTPIVFMSFLIVVLSSIFLYMTKTGLHMRAAGEHPLALETIGVSVKKIRYAAVIISGLLCGLAGAYLSIENAASFTEGMTNGRGFIALAANISGGWRPAGSYLFSLFFGFADALQFKIQAMQVFDIPSELFTMLPYIITILIVAGLVRKSKSPKALGTNFIIEKTEI